MKNILVLLTIFMVTNNLQSQFGKDPILNLQNEDKARLNFGYYLGGNQYDFQFEFENDIGQDVLVEKNIGFKCWINWRASLK